jgi:hypothetical protein
MKITNVKAMVAKMFTVGLIAAAVAIAAPTKAEAQVSFGIHVGAAPYYPPAYGRPVAPVPVYGFYGQSYYGHGYEFDRREAFERHEAFERSRYWDRRRDFDHRERR